MRNTMQHTPGPWTVSARQGKRPATIVLDADKNEVCEVYAASHLIAAAPAMLEALRDAHMGVCNWIPTNANGRLAKENLLQKIDRAIRAATGE